VPIEKTDVVGSVLFQILLSANATPSRFKYKVFVPPVAEWYTYQDCAALLDFVRISPGATPNPCPTVALAPVPVYVTTENPAVVFALTDDVIVPAVLLTAVPPAFQFQATNEEPELFN